MYEYARAHGFDKLVTGHYAKIVIDESGAYRLARAADAGKDQSYFLYNIGQDKLKDILFPLGDLSKDEVRKIAAEAGLDSAEKPDSQDICFVSAGRHADFIENYRGGAFLPGNFTDTSGHVLGIHDGIAHYTIGQRKGLGVALGRPVFVKEIRPAANEVILADESEVFSKEIEICKVNLFTNLVPRAQVMVRYRANSVWATIEKIRDGSLSIKFDEPVRAPAKGQAAVLYTGNLVVGGGEIL